jgi:hypothetical protein
MRAAELDSTLEAYPTPIGLVKGESGLFQLAFFHASLLDGAAACLCPSSRRQDSSGTHTFHSTS